MAMTSKEIDNLNDAATLRIVVVDDSALFRLLIRDVLQAIPGCKVVGVAKNGRDALDAIEQHRPDVVTLDVEMPVMDGIETLREMKRRRLKCKTIMVSRLTESGAAASTDALLEGAFDVILKPGGKTPSENKAALAAALKEKITGIQEAQSPELSPTGASPDVSPTGRSRIKAVIIGTSTGGPDALRQVVPGLVANLTVPVVIIQHMPPGFTNRLAQRLDEMSSISVREAEDGDKLQPAVVLLAPGGRQLKLAGSGAGSVTVKLTDDPPEHGCHPSVDYTLRSAVEVFDGHVLTVILTGMGRDGTEGCRLVRSRGGQVIAQHAEDCVVYGMPRSVITNNLAHRIIRLDRVAATINREVRAGQTGS